MPTRFFAYARARSNRAGTPGSSFVESFEGPVDALNSVDFREPKANIPDLGMAGNVPQGAGLSSSASLEVAIGQFFKSLHGLEITPTELALIGQRMIDSAVKAAAEKRTVALVS